MRRDKLAVSTWEGLKTIHPKAAGLDIGSAEIWVAVAPDRPAEPVRKFGTFTPDLHALADHLVACGVDSVVMESTGCTGSRCTRSWRPAAWRSSW